MLRRPAPAGQVVIDPTISVGGGEDVWIEDSANKNGLELRVGQSNSGKPDRALLKFDLAAAGVPANATVLSARLRLNYYQSFTYGPPWLDRNIEAHQMLVNWAEAQATDSKRTATANWAAPLGQAGADYNSAIESSVLFTAATPMPSFQYWDLTSLTQQWVNGAAANYGVILLADNENQIAHDLRFHSADSTPNSVNQPVLEVVWTQQQRSVYYLKDHLGSVRASVDDNGQLLSRDDYDPWGLQLAGRSMTAQPNLPNKFTGKEWDDDFGLNVYHIGARRYDPEIGRFLSPDPAADDYPQINPYNYAQNEPLGVLDLNGERPITKEEALKLKLLMREHEKRFFFLEGYQDRGAYVFPFAQLRRNPEPLNIGGTFERRKRNLWEYLQGLVGYFAPGLGIDVDPNVLKGSDLDFGGKIEVTLKDPRLMTFSKILVEDSGGKVVRIRFLNHKGYQIVYWRLSRKEFEKYKKNVIDKNKKQGANAADDDAKQYGIGNNRHGLVDPNAALIYAGQGRIFR